MHKSILNDLIQNGLSFDSRDANGDTFSSGATAHVSDDISIHASITETGDFFLSTMLRNYVNDKEQYSRLGYLTDIRGEISPRDRFSKDSSETYFRLNLMMSVLDGKGSEYATITADVVVEKLNLAGIITETLREVQVNHAGDLRTKKESFIDHLDSEKDKEVELALKTLNEECVAVGDNSEEIIRQSLNYAQTNEATFILTIHGLNEQFQLEFSPERKIKCRNDNKIISHKIAAKMIKDYYIAQTDASILKTR
ncbi:hypothetical protein LMH73_014415 [Vibrio splendidus]|nr:hypothetical protein [Vibrio splendidus]MCC4882512.1 hypothetical protein [Vibrio splendidus]